MPDIAYVWVILAGYLLGSISFAVIISRCHGVDILKAGSGNPGATNVKRVLGKKAGNTVFVLDFLKGFVATAWPLLFWKDGNYVISLQIAGMMAAIIGHSFSIFLKFRGGKGVATAMGGLLALSPWVLIVGVLLWIIVFYLSRYVSLASIVFGLSLPLSSWLLGDERIVTWFLLLLALLIIVRHRSNIKRLIQGTENRFEKKSG